MPRIKFQFNQTVYSNYVVPFKNLVVQHKPHEYELYEKSFMC